jgi:hypothetical protein
MLQFVMLEYNNLSLRQELREAIKISLKQLSKKMNFYLYFGTSRSMFLLVIDFNN